MLTTIINLVVVLIILGVALWFMERKLTIDPDMKILIKVVVILGAVLYLLSVIGLWHGFRA